MATAKLQQISTWFVFGENSMLNIKWPAEAYSSKPAKMSLANVEYFKKAMEGGNCESMKYILLSLEDNMMRT